MKTLRGIAIILLSVFLMILSTCRDITLADSEPIPQLMIDKVDDSSFPDNQVFLALLDPQGFPIKDLTKGDFSLSEIGSPITDFTLELIKDETQPLAIMLAIDTSGSMSGIPINDAVSAAKDLYFPIILSSDMVDTETEDKQ